MTVRTTNRRPPGAPGAPNAPDAPDALAKTPKTSKTPNVPLYDDLPFTVLYGQIGEEMKRKPVSIIITILIICILTGILAVAAFAGAPGDSYTATVKYYDDVMITYSLDYPNGGSWNGSGDIPIGGTDFASQLYCADPFVAFHSMAEVSWTDTTTDKVAGYVVAAPWAVSAAMRQSYDAVRWIVINGYHGAYNHGRDDDAESKDSVAWMQALYPGVGSIDKTVALMATKVAIWKTLAGDSVKIIRTSLDPVRNAVFEALVDAMVSDAFNGRETGKDYTRIALSIDESSPAETSGGYTYIPLTITAQLDNPGAGAGAAALDGVFLTVSGPDSDNIAFTSGVGAAELPAADAVYGTGQQAHFLDGGSFTNIGGTWQWTADVYMRVRAARSPRYGDMLTVKAMAMATNVPLCPGTPVTLVYGGGGIQDWEHVQAFTGAAKDGMSTNLYAEAGLYTGETALGELSVRKFLVNGTASDEDKEFAFYVEYSPNADFSGAERLDLSDHPVLGAADVIAADNVFTLRNGGMAVIEGVPAAYYYRVTELGDGLDGYETPVYAINGSDGVQAALNSGDYRTSVFQMDGAEASITFSNSKSIQIQYAQLRIAKVAIGLDAQGESFVNMMGREFEFTLQYRTAQTEGWLPVDLRDRFYAETAANAPEGVFGGGRLTVDGRDGRFILSHYGQATIEVDPACEYRVIENAGEDFASAYALSIYENGAWRAMSSAPANSYWKNRGQQRITDEFSLSPEGYYKLVFTNVDIPSFDLTISKTVTGAESVSGSGTVSANASGSGAVSASVSGSGTVSANASGSGSASVDEFYEFEIINTAGGISTTTPWTLPLTTDPDYFNAMLVKGGEGLSLDGRITGGSGGTVLRLKHGETAIITNLPAGHYIVRELAKEGYTAEFRIDGGALAQASGGSTTDIHLLSDTRVEFVNSVKVENVTPEEKGDAQKPETPDEKERPDVPETTETPDVKPDIPAHIVFSGDKNHTDYPEVDFTGTQQNPSTPGGGDRGAPPVMHNPGDTLMPQYDDDGNLIFIELGPDGVPLGVWHWDEDEELWVFDEEVPLADFPNTGGPGFPYWMMAVSAFMLFTGAALEVERDRRRAAKRV